MKSFVSRRHSTWQLRQWLISSGSGMLQPMLSGAGTRMMTHRESAGALSISRCRGAFREQRQTANCANLWV